jgi:hypothetical protein
MLLRAYSTLSCGTTPAPADRIKPADNAGFSRSPYDTIELRGEPGRVGETLSTVYPYSRTYRDCQRALASRSGVVFSTPGKTIPALCTRCRTACNVADG